LDISKSEAPRRTRATLTSHLHRKFPLVGIPRRPGGPSHRRHSYDPRPPIDDGGQKNYRMEQRPLSHPNFKPLTRRRSFLALPLAHFN
jgi:hypothetical protein